MNVDIERAHRAAAKIETAIADIDDPALMVAALSDVFSSVLAGYSEDERGRVIKDFAAGVELLLPAKVEELTVGRT